LVACCKDSPAALNIDALTPPPPGFNLLHENGTDITTLSIIRALTSSKANGPEFGSTKTLAYDSTEEYIKIIKPLF
jgi:hypothetical protein